MRVHVDMTLLALLTCVSPGVPRHPLTLTFGTLVLSETAFLTLVGCEALPAWTRLQYYITLVLAFINALDYTCVRKST